MKDNNDYVIGISKDTCPSYEIQRHDIKLHDFLRNSLIKKVV